jgi:hypothetical protein
MREEAEDREFERRIWEKKQRDEEKYGPDPDLWP